MTDQVQPADPRAGSVLLTRALSALAAAAALALGLSLSLRPLSSPDLGYHLAYGNAFLDTGHIVDDDRFVRPRAPGDRAPGDDLPPGAYYDSHGRFRFVNANWLSQVIMAGVHRLGGWGALNAMVVVLTAMIFALQAGVLRRMGASWKWLGAVWLGTALGSYERLLLRPEMLGYVCLLLQLWLLCGRITWRRVGASVAVQVVAANVHGYWSVNTAIVLAFTADAAARALWARHVRRRPVAPELRQALVRLLVCSALVIAAPLVSPATWRTLLHPVQTVALLREQNIVGTTAEEFTAGWETQSLHPWALIGEFHTPFSPWKTKTTDAFIILLAASGLATAVLLWRRQWGAAAIIALCTAVAMTMRRNIAPASMVIWPMAAAAGQLLVARRSQTQPAARASPLRAAASRNTVKRIAQATALGIVAAASLWFLASVLTNRFYVGERRVWRFGWGLSSATVPVGPCRWLDQHLSRPQPVFTDYNSSSNVLFLAAKVTEVPVLTNTWAMPFSRMRRVIAICAGWPDPEPSVSEGADIPADWNMDAAMLHCVPTTYPLAAALLASDQWALVHVETWYLVFLRRTAENAQLIESARITLESFDLDAYLRTCRQSDPEPAFGLRIGAATLHGLGQGFTRLSSRAGPAGSEASEALAAQATGWLRLAAEAWRECLRQRDDFHEAWLNLGVCLAYLGQRELTAMVEHQNAGRHHQADQALRAGRRDWLEARRCFRRALEIRSDYEPARAGMRNINAQLQALDQGRVLQMQYLP
ncbi:MAG TPA: hypothetical protein VNA25_18485 [Phycisphaerae bacterium]|nr:hypothetical protein [Phycisphaerae bacterium]